VGWQSVIGAVFTVYGFIHAYCQSQAPEETPMNEWSYAAALGRGAGLIPVLILVLCLVGVGVLNTWENHQPVPTETLRGQVVAISPIIERHCAMTLRYGQTQQTFRLQTADCQRLSVGDIAVMYREQYHHDMKGQWREWELRK